MIEARFLAIGRPRMSWRMDCDVGACMSNGGSRGAAVVGPSDYFAALARFRRLGWHVFPSGDARLPVVHVCGPCFDAIGRGWTPLLSDGARARRDRRGPA